DKRVKQGVIFGVFTNGLSVVSEIANQYENENVVTAPSQGNGNGINGNTIRCYNCQGEDHYASNYTQASTSGTQTDKAPVYDSDGSAEDDAYLQKQMKIAQKEEAVIQLTSEEFDFMAATGDCEEIKRDNANFTL
nr:hypothetical protein [Tanacetum cinerariifolium]